MNEAIAIICGLITLAISYKVIFDNKEDFIEHIKFWLTPDIFSFFRGKYMEDFYAELRLFIWIGISVGVGLGVFHKLSG